MSARILLSCGEPSGDLYAGALTRELRTLDPGVLVEGLGGAAFAGAGGRLIDDYRDLSVTGLAEAVAKIPRSLEAMRRLVRAATRERPDVLVVIDFPDFNLRLAQRIKRLGVPVVYYIAPQLWAWRAGRMKTIRALIDQVLVIFPFEAPLYERAGVPVQFVGHPLVELIDRRATRAAFLASLGLDPSAPTVAVLPGSRVNEVHRILPVLNDAAKLIAVQVPRVQFVVARAPGLDDALFDSVGREGMPPIRLVHDATDAVLASADLALTASGTATVQTALHDTPMVVVYRLSPLSYSLGRRFVKIDTFAMVNLIAGERVVPELIQDACTPGAVAEEAVSLLTDPKRAATMRQRLSGVRNKLGGVGASRKAAEALLRVAAAHRSGGAVPSPVGAGRSR